MTHGADATVIHRKQGRMCRNIRTLFNYEPLASEDEVRAAALQYVRKISGMTRPSRANEAAFHAAVDQIACISTQLLRALATGAPPKDRETGAAKARSYLELLVLLKGYVV